jgi:hypothetical protein
VGIFIYLDAIYFSLTDIKELKKIQILFKPSKCPLNSGCLRGGRSQALIDLVLLHKKPNIQVFYAEKFIKIWYVGRKRVVVKHLGDGSSPR